MSNPHQGAGPSEDDSRARTSSSGGPARNSPLVIVSERGRHSEASRRIVRAQAARASAAQSRETRARNREDRHHRDGPQSSAENLSHPSRQLQPGTTGHAGLVTLTPQYGGQGLTFINAGSQDHSRNEHQPADQRRGPELEPLVNWVTNVLRLSGRLFAASAIILSTTGKPQLSNASDVLFNAGGVLADNGEAMQEVQVKGGTFDRRLPIALPRGFVSLQQRVQISDGFLVLLSRTACFDFGSPGVEDRLNELLYDIVMTSASVTLAAATESAHPIESILRIACACLTIFQGQRADGQSLAYDQKYNSGFEAAWNEVVVLDQEILKDPQSAEAALWAVFVISVTCGRPENYFHQLLWRLMEDLQLRQWDDVRTVLLSFIYPGSFLDEPCRHFFEQLHIIRPDVMRPA